MAAQNRPPVQTPPRVPAFEPHQAPKPRNGTPQELLEQDIAHFFEELNDLSKVPFYGSTNVDGRLGFYGAQEWVEQMRPLNQQMQIILDKIEVVKLENNLAEVKLSMRIEPRNGGGELPQPIVAVETTTWRFGQRSRQPFFGDQQNRWRIVPPEALPENPEEHPMAYTAYSLGQPPGPSAAAIQVQQQAVSNARQIGLGIMMFAQDYDNFLAFDNAHYKKALLPYVKNDQVFAVPGSKDEFTFNEPLSGHAVTEFRDTPHTVLLYDGTGQTLNYRFDGKAVVVFADGHAELVDAERAKTLVWDPFTKAP